jgi:hypothetical protein
MTVTFPAQQITRRKTRTALIGQGQRMSNWMFNMKQSPKLLPDIREELRLMQEAWDKLIDEDRNAGGKTR